MRQVDISLSINHQTDAKISQGLPILIQAELVDVAEKSPFSMPAKAKWEFQIKDEKAKKQDWRLKTMQEPLCWSSAPETTKKLKVGSYEMLAFLRLDKKIIGQSGVYSVRILTNEQGGFEKEKDLLNAEFYLLEKDYASALKAVESLLNKQPFDTDALLLKGEIFEKSGRKEEAVEAYAAVLPEIEGHSNQVAITQRHNHLMLELLKEKSMKADSGDSK